MSLKESISSFLRGRAADPEFPISPEIAALREQTARVAPLSGNGSSVAQRVLLTATLALATLGPGALTMPAQTAVPDVAAARAVSVHAGDHANVKETSPQEPRFAEAGGAIRRSADFKQLQRELGSNVKFVDAAEMMRLTKGKNVSAKIFATQSASTGELHDVMAVFNIQEMAGAYKAGYRRDPEFIVRHERAHLIDLRYGEMRNKERVAQGLPASSPFGLSEELAPQLKEFAKVHKKARSEMTGVEPRTNVDYSNDLHELFADGVAMFQTRPDVIKRHAPDLVQEFERLGLSEMVKGTYAYTPNIPPQGPMVAMSGP